MKILGFAGSNSKKSINKALIEYTLDLFENVEFEIVDLINYEVPIFSVDKENEFGIPKEINEFARKIDTADLIVISLAEHNGSYSTAFKNIYDWLSRVPNRKVFNGKPLFLMATSPGGRGGSSVLAAAKERFPRDGAEILGTFSFPEFQNNFDINKGITNIYIA